MTYKLAPGVLAAVLVGLPAAAHADPVTIVNSYSGISVLAYASEGGASERRSFPHTFADIISRELTAHVGGTSATASASLASSQADPAHMWGNGAATAQYQTTNGTAGVSATAVFAVRFQLAAPHAYEFHGDFTSSGSHSRDPFITDSAFWLTSLYRDSSEIFSGQGNDAARLVRTGVLNPGLYYFLVQSSAIGSTALGPATVNASGNFGVTLDLTAQAVPAPVPEPASILLLGTGLAGLVGLALRRRSRVRGELSGLD